MERTKLFLSSLRESTASTWMPSLSLSLYLLPFWLNITSAEMLNNSQNGWEKQFSVLESVSKLTFCGFIVEWSRFLLARPSWKAAINYDFAATIALTYHLRHHSCCFNQKNMKKDKKILTFFFTPRGTPQPTGCNPIRHNSGLGPGIQKRDGDPKAMMCTGPLEKNDFSIIALAVLNSCSEPHGKLT